MVPTPRMTSPGFKTPSAGEPFSTLLIWIIRVLSVISFRVAQIFHDRLMNTDKARKMLGALKSKYPEHDIIPHVENYLANI